MTKYDVDRAEIYMNEIVELAVSVRAKRKRVYQVRMLEHLRDSQPWDDAMMNEFNKKIEELRK